MNSDQLNQLQAIIQYNFSNTELLQRAMTHKSASGQNNERLEFLGDAILGFVIADLLYQRYPKAKEGELTRRRANLVNGRALSEIAKEMNLGDYLILGSGEKLSGGFRRESILANCFEAILGALYYDAGYELCRAKIEHWLKGSIEKDQASVLEKDAKTELQEWLQAQQRPLPVYTVQSIDGPQHDQIFTVSLEVQGEESPIIASGKSRRIAEQNAAKQYLQKVKTHES